MTTELREKLHLRAGKTQNEALAGWRGTYRFDLGDAGVWFLGVDNGAVEVAERDEPAQCVIRCSAPEFLSFLANEQNMLTALLQGRIQVAGDMQLAQRLHSYLRSEEWRKQWAEQQQ